MQDLIGLGEHPGSGAAGHWGTDLRQPEDYYCEIKTLEGVMRGDCYDYIIQGVKGEIYPCKPDIFLATYEAVL